MSINGKYPTVIEKLFFSLEKNTPFYDNCALEYIAMRLEEIGNYESTPSARRLMHVVVRNLAKNIQDILNKRNQAEIDYIMHRNPEEYEVIKERYCLGSAGDGDCEECFLLRIREWSIGTEVCNRCLVYSKVESIYD